MTIHVKSSRASLSVIGTLVLVLALGMTGFARVAEGDTYAWHSELVELDTAEGTATLKSRILGYAETDDMASFMQGDVISLTWSGINGRASGIRAVQAEFTQDSDAEFTMPVEFVATELDGRYLTFRLPISSDGIDAIRSLEPGQWVTLTSPHAASTLDAAVVSVHPYNSRPSDS